MPLHKLFDVLFLGTLSQIAKERLVGINRVKPRRPWLGPGQILLFFLRPALRHFQNMAISQCFRHYLVSYRGSLSLLSQTVCGFFEREIRHRHLITNLAPSSLSVTSCQSSAIRRLATLQTYRGMQRLFNAPR